MSSIHYKPLPDFLEIRKSSIEGNGLYTKKKLQDDYIIGITHIRDERFENGYIRTPLGAFFNHSSDKDNIEIVHIGDWILIRTKRIIDKNEELLANYTLYNPEK
mgnify:CR=1 FL=1|jgi:hypothetical protein